MWRIYGQLWDSVGVMKDWDGQEFKRRREELGYTQQGFAELVGVSGQALGKWERNESTPTYRHLQRIHAVLAGEVAETPTQLRAVIEAQQQVLARLAALIEEQSDELDGIAARLAAVEVVLGQRRES